MSLRFPISRRNNPSAIGLRQILPVQTKRTFFTVRVALAMQSERKFERAQGQSVGERRARLELDRFIACSVTVCDGLESAGAIGRPAVPRVATKPGGDA